MVLQYVILFLRQQGSNRCLSSFLQVVLFFIADNGNDHICRKHKQMNRVPNKIADLTEIIVNEKAGDCHERNQNCQNNTDDSQCFYGLSPFLNSAYNFALYL